jgi:nitrogenase molybdenum-cofactor synthesis protein NifE
VGVIGDDVEAVCKKMAKKHDIPVIPVHSEGFAGTKKDGYTAACNAIYSLIGTGDSIKPGKFSINILGDFNLAGEIWMLKEYYEKMGIEVIATITGDGRVDQIRHAHKASLNLVQCSGSMTHLAELMKKNYNIPYMRVSYFGIEDMSSALYEVAEFFGDETMLEKTRELVSSELKRILPEIREYAKALKGKKAAIYVGGAFKAISLIKALNHLGMKTVVVGSQTGDQHDYSQMKELCDDDTIIVDDSNPIELSTFVIEKGADIFIGGVKERPIAYKLGLGFCDHNHERKEALAGYEGMLNFAREVYSSTMSPVWKYVRDSDTYFT